MFWWVHHGTSKTRKVDLAIGQFRFAPVLYLEPVLKEIEKLEQSTYEQIIEKYVEMNIAHPFREGNGRATRIWLDQILKKEIGKMVDWNEVDKDEYFSAMIMSLVNDLPIKELLRPALTDKIADHETYFKGIDASYYYEGYTEFKTEDL